MGREKYGFTLIELLVVVSIIGLLSSVVLASLKISRDKGKDSLIKREMHELSTLMALEYSESGSYCNLHPNQVNGYWLNNSATCATIPFSGSYATQARQLCSIIYNNANDGVYTPGQYRILVFAGNTSGSVSTKCGTTYSFTAQLNKGNWFCQGPDGASEASNYYSPGTPGCYINDP